jgi:hypothetical protein
VEKLLLSSFIDKCKLDSIISSLCGTEIAHSEDYISDLKKAIKDYDLNHLNTLLI